MSFEIKGEIKPLAIRKLVKDFTEDPKTNKVTTWRGQLQVRPDTESTNLCFSLCNQKNHSIF